MARAPDQDGDVRDDPSFDALLDAAEIGDVAAVERLCSRLPHLEGSADRLAALARAAPSAAPPIAEVGDFALLEPLARGGMGELYRAEQRSLGRPAVVKLLRSERLGSAAAERAFEREARLLAALDHQNVVTIFASGVADGIPWLAMEQLRGRSLADEMAGGALPIRDALRIAADVARALAAAHAAGIVHRDVKPSNVFRCDGGRTVLLDFGIARAEDDQRLTRTGEFRGTPLYASPEQIACRGPIDARSDVFSLGVTLYEALAGRAPFQGDTTDQLFHAILERDPVAPRSARPELSRDVETVLLKALEKEPARRYASAAAFADDLEALLDLRPIAARAAGTSARAARWIRRHRTIAAAIALVGAVLAAVPLTREAERRRAGARQLAAGRTLLAELRGTRLALRSEGRAVEGLALAVNSRHLAEAERERLAAAETQCRLLARATDDAFHGASAALGEAGRLLPGDPAVENLLAELYCERMLQAEDQGDAAGAALFRGMAAHADARGLLAETLNPRSAVSIAAEPEGAGIYLFRYEHHAAVVPGGESRLVPVPIDAAGRAVPGPVPPGSRALRVQVAAPGVAVNDVIVAFAGHPIAGTILAAFDSPDGSVRAFDRLVAVDGRPIREAYDVSCIHDLALAEPDRVRTFRFERDGAPFEVRAAGLDALGVKAWEPDNVLAERGGVVDVYREGKIERVELPRVRAVTTAAPLFLCAANRAGTSPLHGLLLAPGRYLAVVRAAGFEDQRIPFAVERERPAAVRARLLPEGTSPPGYTFVPGGPFPCGGDVRSFAGFEHHAADVDDFWMLERELCFGDWLRFANSSAAESAAARVPRSGDPPLPDPRWQRGADGTWSIPPGRALFPVYGVSWHDAVAYVAWLNREGAAAGDPFEYALPAEREWEKAARGADGRWFPFGDQFQPTFVKSRFARDRVIPEWTMRFPVDESPYGVFDLCGGMWEWCADWWNDAEDGKTVRGGAWDFIYEANFRSASRAAVDPNATLPNLGVRLVARLRRR